VEADLALGSAPAMTAPAIAAGMASPAILLDSRACRSGSLRPWGKRNAICSSLSDLAPSHTRTARFRSATARPYRSRSTRTLAIAHE
jgi:hypothetical protein